jgi:hypothetical protein
MEYQHHAFDDQQLAWQVGKTEETLRRTITDMAMIRTHSTLSRE